MHCLLVREILYSSPICIDTPLLLVPLARLAPEGRTPSSPTIAYADLSFSQLGASPRSSSLVRAFLPLHTACHADTEVMQQTVRRRVRIRTRHDAPTRAHASPPATPLPLDRLPRLGAPTLVSSITSSKAIKVVVATSPRIRRLPRRRKSSGRPFTRHRLRRAHLEPIFN